MRKTLVIAEAGSCHDGSFDKALDLVDAAKECGADAVKFQFWSDADKLAQNRSAGKYRDIYRKYKVPDGWLQPLSDHCAKAGIEFACTVYLAEDIAYVSPYVRRFKVSSFESLDSRFVKSHLPYKKPIIISTGMCSIDDLRQYKWIGGDISFLHCVSAYPAPMEQLNLAAIGTMARETGRPCGYSDHSTSPLTGALAVMAGASIIEAHLSLGETSRDNPDFAHARTPGMFKLYTRYIRDAEKAAGSNGKYKQSCEDEMSRYRVIS